MARARRVDPRVGTRVAAYVKGAELGPVAAILRAQRDEILSRWLEAARRQPFHATRPERAVADQIPPLFDALVAFLDRHAPRRVDPTSPLDDAAVRDLARAHARDRFQQGLGAPDVLTEFRLLRQEIGRALREGSDGAGDMLAAELLVHDALDGATTLALAALEAHEAEYQRTQATLRFQSELLEQAHEAIFAWDPAAGITFWNRGAEELYGFTVQEALGRSSHDLLGTSPEQVAAFLAVLHRDRRWEGELSHTTHDGRRITVEARLALVTGQGRQHVLEATRDLTARRAAEDRLALLAEAGGVLAGSIEYQATLANIAHIVVPRLADWCVVDVLGPRPALERVAIVHVDQAKASLVEALQQQQQQPQQTPSPADADPTDLAATVLRTGEPLLVEDVPTTIAQAARDPRRRALIEALGPRSAMAVPLRARSQVLGVISLFVAAESGRRYGPDDLRTAIELADRAALAIDNARLYREAQDAVHLREQLLAVVAHDLRNPLTTIKGTADLLQRQADRGRLEPDRLTDRLATISQAASTMSAQIGELLDAARLRAGQPLELRRQPTDLVALVRRTAEHVQLTTTTQHTLHVQAAVETLVGIWDPLRLERVLGNLLGNAVKYSPDGGDVCVEIVRDEPGWAVVTVRDAGIGVPAADLPHVFERYHRAANVIGRFPGEGIGLPGAKQVVDQHGGTIEVTSEEGHGATVTVRLPLSPPDAPA